MLLMKYGEWTKGRMSDIKMKQDHSERMREIVAAVELEWKKKPKIFYSQQIIENWSLANEWQEVT